MVVDARQVVVGNVFLGVGGPHDYAREPSDRSNVDEVKVNPHVEKRLITSQDGTT